MSQEKAMKRKKSYVIDFLSKYGTKFVNYTRSAKRRLNAKGTKIAPVGGVL